MPNGRPGRLAMRERIVLTLLATLPVLGILLMLLMLLVMELAGGQR